MENHPIPQDITGFQFKLIGDMTIKQFAYLAGGIVLGWLLFASPFFMLIKLPLAVTSIFLGVGMAFLPIEGRPMDLMFENFIKAIFSPTQFVYQKTGGQLWEDIKPVKKSSAKLVPQKETTSLSGEELKSYLNSLPKRPKNQLDQKEMVFFESLSNMYSGQTQTNPIPQAPPAHAFANVPVPGQQQPPTQLPAASQVQIPVEQGQQQEEEKPSDEEETLKRETLILQQELAEAKAAETSKINSTEYTEAHKKVMELETMLSETAKQKQELEKQIELLQKQLTANRETVYTPSVAQEPVKETRNVRSIPQNLGKSVGLPLAPEFPNIVTGIVKDPRGNPLQNILVEVKDAEGNPVRAFKTNPLGQFASATPITNGTYTIEFEDSKGENKFDVIEFSATGQIILPIEVISVDTREELRRSLFN